MSAIAPDIPPNWTTVPPSIRDPLFQGVLYTNNYPPPSNGQYSMTFQLMDVLSNGLPVSPTYTQTVQVVNGLVNAPLHFNPSCYYGGPTWLSIGVKAAGEPGPISHLTPALPLTPTPQAFYAYSAGVVADLSPGQAVTSLNGLTDAVQLQPGPGVFLGTNGNVLTISAAITSDRKLKTDFSPVNSRSVLDQLTALPMQRWRYLNEDERVRHLGPMAQDFKSAFGLGSDDKMIGLVDADGVALAAIQGLNQKLEETRAENAELKTRLEKLEQIINSKNGGAQ